jgi:hypothetical protein
VDLLTLCRDTKSMLFTRLHFDFHSSLLINITPPDYSPVWRRQMLYIITIITNHNHQSFCERSLQHIDHRKRTYSLDFESTSHRTFDHSSKHSVEYRFKHRFKHTSNFFLERTHCYDRTPQLPSLLGGRAVFLSGPARPA